LEKVNDKNFVKDGYNECAEKYQDARFNEKEPSLNYIFHNLKENAKILDIGCGAGVPVFKLLSEKYDITGIDISEKMIELAKKNLPNGKFIISDILDYDFNKSQFDAIVSYYTLFHLPREKHILFIKKCHDLLKNNGILIVTVGMYDEDSYTEDFFGTRLYWSNYNFDFYKKMILNNNFIIVDEKIISHGYDKNKFKRDESHPLIIARKKS
jgi:2-polyprenyl-3-methyl-5-hydroxy-6-metoxy-1,4-benzoquinol methylase